MQSTLYIIVPWLQVNTDSILYFFEQLHSLFNLAHQFRVAVLRDRPLDYILKVTELPVGIIATSYLSSFM